MTLVPIAIGDAQRSYPRHGCRLPGRAELIDLHAFSTSHRRESTAENPIRRSPVGTPSHDRGVAKVIPSAR